MRFNSFFISGCAALALAGCKTDLSQISDEQLLSLLGNGGSPAQITTATRECIEILGGINERVYQDVPEDLMGMMKTDCRRQLQEWLDDPDRNSTALELADFERTDLAERIIVLDEAQAAEREALREAEAVARIEQMRSELAEVIAQGQELRTAFEARRAVLAPACENLRALRAELQAKNRIHSLFNRGLPRACSGETLRLEADQLVAFEERISGFEIPEPGNNRFVSVPTLPRIDLEEIDLQIERVEAVTIEYNAALSEE